MYADVLRPYINKTLKLNNQSLKTLIVLFETRGFSSIILSKAVSIYSEINMFISKFVSF